MSDLNTTTALTDCRRVAERLRHEGFAHDEAYKKASLFATSAAFLPPVNDPVAAFVPGRVEVLGKHTDYAGGRSMVACVERGFCVVAGARTDGLFRIMDASRGEEVSFAIGPELTPTSGHWSNYPMTVARRVSRNFGQLRGLDLAFASDLPPAAGMSSSSALMIGCFIAMASINQLQQHPEYVRNIGSREDLAGYLAAVENGQSFGALAGDSGVGTFGGSEDHTAILCCRAGQIAQYSYCPLRFERSIDMPGGYAFAIGVSGVAAEKTGQAMERYNRASRLARAAVERWNAATGRSDAHLAAAVRGSADAQDRLRAILRDDSPLLDRFEQFVAESEQVMPSAADALAKGDVASLGTIVDRSQRLAETLLGNQVPETVFLAKSARELGAAASSAFGAGFGGSVWAMIEAGSAPGFLHTWSGRYRNAFPQAASHSAFLLTRPGPSAFRLAG